MQRKYEAKFIIRKIRYGILNIPLVQVDVILKFNLHEQKLYKLESWKRNVFFKLVRCSVTNFALIKAVFFLCE